MESYVLTVGDKHAAGRDDRRLQLAAQGTEGRAEVVAAGGQVHLRPEEVDETLPGMALSQVQRQVGEQHGGLVGTEAIDDAISAPNAQLSQQLDVAACIHARVPLAR